MGGDAGLDDLLKGTVWLNEGGREVCRLALFKTADIERMAKKPIADADPKPKASLAAIQRAFDNWRASQAPRIPTYIQDVEYMKDNFGVGRNKVRDLRKAAERNPLGRPKKACS